MYSETKSTPDGMRMLANLKLCIYAKYSLLKQFHYNIAMSDSD